MDLLTMHYLGPVMLAGACVAYMAESLVSLSSGWFIKLAVQVAVGHQRKYKCGNFIMSKPERKYILLLACTCTQHF